MLTPPTAESMKECKTALGRIWLTEHEILGFVVFDPSMQRLTGKGEVRLYIVAENRTGTFNCEALKGKLKHPQRSASSAQGELLDAALASFNRMNSLLAFVASQKGHCTWCGQAYGHNNFTYCPKCEWINCACGDAQCPCLLYPERQPRPKDFMSCGEWDEEVTDSELLELYDDIRREGMEYADMVYANNA